MPSREGQWVQAFRDAYHYNADYSNDPMDDAILAVGRKAEELLLADLGGDVTRHKVKFFDRQFILEHPLRERLDGSLMQCQAHHIIAQGDEPTADEYGLYWMDFTEEGDFFLEYIGPLE